MSKNKITKINEQIEIPKMRLWLVWLLLFVFPSIATIIGFKYFSEQYKYFERTDLISKGFERIKEYNTKIVIENFLEEQVKSVKNLSTNQPLTELKNNIDINLCGETLFCFFFDKTVSQTVNIKGQQCDKIIKNIPNAFIKKNIKNLIENNSTSNNNLQTNIDKINKDKANFGSLLQHLFKSITSVTISPDKVSRNYSVLYGGELYFIFCIFDKPTQDCLGFFAVMRGQDFSFHKMIEKLHPEYPEIRIIFRDIDIEKAFYNPEKLHSGLKRTKNGLYIISPTDIKFARYVVFGGSEKIIEKYKHLLPLIEYRIPTEQYNNYIQKRNHQINLIALIILITSGVYFLRISLFGFSNNISFKNKIMFLAFSTAIFPFSVFTIGFYNIENYNKIVEKISLQQHAETEIQLISQELEQYKTEVETKVSEYGIELSKMLENKDLKPSTLLEYLDKIGEVIPTSVEILYLEPFPQNLEIICSKNRIIKKFPKRLSENSIDEEKDSISNLLPQTILEALTNEESKQNREKFDELVIAGEKVTSAFINESLQNVGKLTKLEQLGPTSWYILQQLHDNKTPDHKAIGVYIVKFEPLPILESFLAKSSLQKKDFQEKTESYEINYAFIPMNENEETRDWYGSKDIDKKDIDRCINNSQSGEINIELENKIIIKKRNQQIPFLTIASIKELETYINKYFLIILLISVLTYLSLILIFANKLLDIMFVEPVMLLASNANAIARGSDKWEVEINSGDEFEDLNNDFKLLVTGLQERNILKSYVSEDAFSDIEGTDSLKLLPSGEYLEATIVFSAIKDYDKLSSSITPQESIKLLSNFMSIAEKVSKEYGGSIDKIIGNTIMLVFRNNPNNNFHAFNAAKASLKLVEEAKSIGLPRLYTGISSGRVISGRIGSYSGRLDFTVIGNPVNMAARLKTEAQNGSEETGIIISEEIIELLGNNIEARFLRRVSIKGKSNKYNIFELLNIKK